jgi:hypothetical protein
VLYRAQGVLSEIHAAPEGGLVGTLERLWEENVGKERATYIDRRVDERGVLRESYYFEAAQLVIVNLDGAVLDRISDVRRYAWGPRGRTLAYVTGSYDEDGIGFRTTGTWVYDLASRESKRIYDAGVDLQWAQWDGNVYVYDPFDGERPDVRVLRFDPETDQLTTSTHRGIRFSPNGRYYYEGGGSEALLRVFETATEAEVGIDLSIPSADRPRAATAAAGWLDDSVLILPSPLPGDKGDFLYDIETGALQYATGAVVSRVAPGARVLLQQGTTVVESSRDQLMLVRQQPVRAGGATCSPMTC